jgi:hypothetical protein
MIVHVYRETDAINPELVGRHRRLRSFIGAEECESLPRGAEPQHEIERFLIDPAGLEAWSRASSTGGLLEQRWSVVDLRLAVGLNQPHIYGKALLASARAGYSPPAPEVDRPGRQL